MSEKADSRIMVNSSGEGSIYVRGPISPGELISTSDVPGVGIASEGEVIKTIHIAKSTGFLAEGECGLVGCIYLC